MVDDGDLIAGRYRVEARVGQHRPGLVWRARDEQLGRAVAIKQLAPHSVTGRAALRAMREARVSAKLQHPYAITLYDVIEHRGEPCLVMELLSTSLADLLVERGRLPRGMVATIGSQVAAALAVAHAHGIVHRDVSPGNVLLTREGTAKIADFGISRATGEPTVTDRPYIPGTPAYLAPEVAGGAESTTRSDVYSLGATLYTALEGRPPVGAVDDDTDVLLARIAGGGIIEPTRAGPLANVLVRLLQRDPAQRPTMAEAAELLAKVAAAPKAASSTPAVPVRRKLVRRLVLAGAVVALVTAGTVVALPKGAAVSPQGTGPPALPGGAPGSRAPSPGAAGCAAAVQVTESWHGGFKAQVTVRNTGQAELKGWAVSWRPAVGRRIDDLWDGVLERSDGSVTIVNASWNGKVAIGGGTSFGLITRDEGAGGATETLTCRVR